MSQHQPISFPSQLLPRACHFFSINPCGHFAHFHWFVSQWCGCLLIFVCNRNKSQSHRSKCGHFPTQLSLITRAWLPFGGHFIVLPTSLACIVYMQSVYVFLCVCLWRDRRLVRTLSFALYIFNNVQHRCERLSFRTDTDRYTLIESLATWNDEKAVFVQTFAFVALIRLLLLLLLFLSLRASLFLLPFQVHTHTHTHTWWARVRSNGNDCIK